PNRGRREREQAHRWRCRSGRSPPDLQRILREQQRKKRDLRKPSEPWPCSSLCLPTCNPIFLHGDRMAARGSHAPANTLQPVFAYQAINVRAIEPCRVRRADDVSAVALQETLHVFLLDIVLEVSKRLAERAIERTGCRCNRGRRRLPFAEGKRTRRAQSC